MGLSKSKNSKIKNEETPDKKSVTAVNGADDKHVDYTDGDIDKGNHDSSFVLKPIV